MTESVPSPGMAVNSHRRAATAWRSIPLLVLLAVWLLTGFFVVSADEAGVLRVCGRAEREPDGSLRLRTSGLYWHLPWPLVSVDRVRINEARTLTVGSVLAGTLDRDDFLQAVDVRPDSRYLTGDRNVLHIQLDVQYRVAADQIGDWLYNSTRHEERLRLLAESVLTDTVLQSGVDFVHTLGHNALRHEVLSRLRDLAATSRIGVDIDDVTIAGVTPPVRVKAEFVDVVNARADRETYVNRARAYAEERLADAEANRQKILNEAHSSRRRIAELAAAEAESFNRLIDQFETVSAERGMPYTVIRDRALQREYLDTLSTIYQAVQAKVVLGSEEPVDITIQRPLGGVPAP